MRHELDLDSRKNRKNLSSFFSTISPRGSKLAEQFGNLWNHIYNDTRSIFKQEETKHLHPRIDVLENQNVYDIRVDLPGVDANSIDLQTHGRTLMLRARRACAEPADFKMSYCEHKAEQYERGIHLAADAVIDEKSATFSDGILSIRIPKKAA